MDRLLTPEQARFLLELLNLPNMVVPTGDTAKLRLALETKEQLESIAGPAKKLAMVPADG
ncbi:MAG: hypothetical protein ACRDUW_26960 [Pseudonocardiaceae bacterium]